MGRIIHLQHMCHGAKSELSNLTGLRNTKGGANAPSILQRSK